MSEASANAINPALKLYSVLMPFLAPPLPAHSTNISCVDRNSGLLCGTLLPQASLRSEVNRNLLKLSQVISIFCSKFFNSSTFHLE